MHLSWIAGKCYWWLIFFTMVYFLSTGTAIASTHENEKIFASLRLTVEEGEQTSLPCPIDMVSRIPVSAVWYHVPTSATMRHGGQHHYGSSHSRKVYGLAAPTPSSTAVGEFSLVDGDHWKQRSWTGRAFFSLLSDPPALRLNKLQREDTGNYFCNVTYLDNATTPAVVLTEAHAELFVAARPCPPIIKDSVENTLKDVAGPFAEGDRVQLRCDIRTCDHDVTLTWFHDGVPLRTSHETVATAQGGRTNLVTLGPLFRKDLRSNLTCVATSNVSLPAATSLLLDVFLPPASVTIWSWNQELPEVSKFSPVAGAYIERSSKRTDNNQLASSGSSIDGDAERDAASATADTSTSSNAPRNYECEASGSRPPANITWFLDGQPLDPTLSQTTFQENVTTSMLSLPVTVREGKLLECRATNGKLPESRGVVSQFLKMDLSQRMEVSVLLGSRLNGSNINEGDDVYMECSVLAASPVTEISWRQDGRELKTGDKTPGLLFSSRFLVIQNVALSNAGRYTCRSTSADGEMAESAPFELRIRHRPRCRATQVRMLEARTNETVNVSCDVKADPDDGLRYLWVAEDDAGHRRRSWRAGSGESADDDHAQEVSSSQLEVLVDTFLFHSTLYCWAKNDVGTQREPCRYRFTLRRHSALRLNCRVGNYTDSSFSLRCTSTRSAHSRGDARVAPESRLRVELFEVGAGNRSERGFWTTAESSEPHFLTGLKPATEYLVVARMEPETALFTTYVRTLAPAQTLRGSNDL